MYPRTNPLELIGKRFGRLTVLEVSTPKIYPSGRVTPRYTCECECGNKKIVTRDCLIKDKTKSCGCLFKETRLQFLTHGHSSSHGIQTPTYKSWGSMLQRCLNPNNPAYYNYGGRGIRVCEQWRVFANFLKDMGEKPSADFSIERKDNDGNYEPGNCKWSTRVEQNTNQRRNLFFTIRGKTGCLSELIKHFGVNKCRTRARIELGWEPELAFFAPKNFRPLVRNHRSGVRRNTNSVCS